MITTAESRGPAQSQCALPLSSLPSSIPPARAVSHGGCYSLDPAWGVAGRISPWERGRGGGAAQGRTGMEPAKPRRRVPGAEEGERGPRARATPGYCRVPLLVADSCKLDALCG